MLNACVLVAYIYLVFTLQIKAADVVQAWPSSKQMAWPAKQGQHDIWRRSTLRRWRVCVDCSLRVVDYDEYDTSPAQHISSVQVFNITLEITKARFARFIFHVPPCKRVWKVVYIEKARDESVNEVHGQRSDRLICHIPIPLLCYCDSSQSDTKRTCI